MDLFEILLFALIAGSGLLSELFKKRRQEQMKRQKDRSGESPVKIQTTESIDSELDQIEESMDSTGESGFEELDTMLEEFVFGKSSKSREKEKFEELTSLENKPTDDLYISDERRASVERQRSWEVTPSLENSSWLKADRPSPGFIPSVESSLPASQLSKNRSKVNQLLSSPQSVRETILAAEILSKPISKRNGPSLLKASSLRTRLNT